MKPKYKSGNTPLIKIEKLCKKFGLPNLFIKDESKNPFGTFKDRRSEFIIRKGIEEHIDKFVTITSGNAGYSLGKFAKGTNIKIVNFVNKKLKKSIKDELKKVSYKIIEIDLSKKIWAPEEIMTMARENDTEVIWDATNGFHGYHEGYVKIVEEIRKKIPGPDFIVVPVGSGEAFCGLYSGIRRFRLKTKLIGVGVKAKWYSFADKLSTPWTPYESLIKTILKEKHEIIRLNEKEVKQMWKEFKNVIDCEPSAAVVFSVFSKLKFKKGDKIILINSGKGLF
jgi:threonine dehydratase